MQNSVVIDTVHKFIDIGDYSLDTLAKLLITPAFRWWVYVVAMSLVIYSYIIEPIRFSSVIGKFGVPYKTESFIAMCITLFFYMFIFLGLWLTIPFTTKLPDLWYIPVIVFIFAIVTHFSYNKPDVVNDPKAETLNPPPSYFQPKSIRKLVYYGILVLDVINFLQGLIYAGISTQFKTTVLHQFFLNRFGGVDPKNLLNFATEWLGLIGIAIDVYWIYGVETFTPCKFNLPASWGI